MKIALWGKGKTGGEILNIYNKDLISGPFGRSNPPTLKQLDDADIILLFIPGNAVDEWLPLLLKSKTPVISGATGYEYDQIFKDKIKSSDKVWVQANNFSLLMMSIKQVIEYFGKLKSIIPHLNFSMKEIHHTKKQDAPSGTAVMWQRWLDQICKIESERIGDEIGTHQLKLSGNNEYIELKHQSLDRKLFAEGAIFACQSCLDLKLTAGFYYFEEIIKMKLNETSGGNHEL